ncbi:hypothetical protein DICPUDRAFT_77030 [Dictyostelium purpureum]|uniref:DH domain-containing protein n=1 Tax=Dictyostelium purpureum TaxID=5786 RepID=F0ZFE2_DICPU|nr:uncharacterized protein DICPUDRAFT_77030 [Dictyostelium purpureum]EGC37339.1 hypothetical protein DICPUDRAFT_77030 [Dictyostelium purpureum]|eukprot:XP_003286153.1 hypothetical protein DICPUDRAFT_77030 [Dictyostelium purpureum]
MNRGRSASNGSVSALINNLNKNKQPSNDTVTPQRKMTGVSNMISKFNSNDSSNNSPITSNSSTPTTNSPPVVPPRSLNTTNNNNDSNIKGTLTPSYTSNNPILKTPISPVSLSAPTSSVSVSPLPLSPRGTIKPSPPPRCLSPTPPQPQSAYTTPTLSPTTNSSNKLPPRPWSPQPQNNNDRPLPPRPWSPQPQNNNNNNNIDSNTNRPLPPRPWSPQPQPPQPNNIKTVSPPKSPTISPPTSPTISPSNSSTNLIPHKGNSNSSLTISVTTPPQVSKRLHSTPEPMNTNQIPTTAAATKTTYNLSQPNASTMPPPTTTTSKPSLPPRPWSINTGNTSPSNSRENSSNNITSNNQSPTTSPVTTSTTPVKPLPKISKPPLPKPSTISNNNKTEEKQEASLSASNLDTPITFSDIRTTRQKTLTRKQATMKLKDGDSSPSNNIVESNSSSEISELASSVGSIGDDIATDSSSRNNSADDLEITNTSNTNNINIENNNNNNTNNNNNNNNNTTSKEKESSTSSLTSFISSHKKKGSFLFNNSNATLRREQTLDLKGVLMEKIQEKHNQMLTNSTRKSKLPPINQSTSVNKVINEIIETEADYLDDLEVIINLYLFAAIELNKYRILSDSDIFHVFSNVEELYHISLKLYPMLLKTIPLLENNQYPNIEEIFLYNSKAFQRYGFYLSSQENSIRVLNGLIDSNQVIQSIFQYVKSLSLCKQLDLHSFLIKPCQRLCKYPLLLRELKKSVPESEEAHHKNFERSVKLMEKIVNDINGKISNDEKIQSIIKEIGNISKENESLLWNQTFIKDSKMRKAFKKKKGYKDVTVYLLSQIILIFEKSTFKKKLIIIPLSKINSVNDIEREHQFGVGINYNKEDNSTHNVSLACDNYSHKLLWINDIDETIQTFKVLNGTYLYVTSDLQNNSGESNSPTSISASNSSSSIASM